MSFFTVGKQNCSTLLGKRWLLFNFLGLATIAGCQDQPPQAIEASKQPPPAEKAERLPPPKIDRTQFKREISAVSLRYHEFRDKYRRTPRDYAEFAAYDPASDPLLASQANFYRAPTAMKMVEDGSLVLIWNAALTGDGEENSKYVLGYEKSVLDDTGFVIMGGGGIESLTTDEFKTRTLFPTNQE